MPAARFAGALFLALAWGRAQAPDLPAGKCRVAGQVVHFAAGTPLRKASVELKRFITEGGVSDSPSVANYSTTSDAQGMFSFEGVEPGVYWLYADRIGYLEQSYGAHEPLLKGTPLRLARGQNRTDLVIKLTPQSFIYGKVADEDGDIVPDAQVQVYKPTGMPGHKRFSVVGSAISQDDGSFVVGNLQAGRYYLSADQPHTVTMGPAEPAAARETFATTFYPNVADPAAASAVDVGAGAEVRGIEIRMRVARAFRIRGKALNTVAGGPAAQTYLKLTSVNRGYEPGHMDVGALTGSDGTFEFRDVAPGDYFVGIGALAFTATVTMVESGRPRPEIQTGPPPLIGRATVHVGEQDVDGLVVPLGEGALVTGTIRMAGEDPGKPSPWSALMLQPADGDGDDPVAAQVKPDGTFRIPRLLPSRYSIQVNGLADGVYVKSVHFEGRSIAGDELDLTSGAGGLLEIELSPNAAAVSGIVRGADGEGAAGATVQVCAGDDTVKYVSADENGAYRVSGLPPGEYRILAWEEVEPELSLDASFRAHFDAQAADVKLAERDHPTVEVKMIAREAIEAEAARLK